MDDNQFRDEFEEFLQDQTNNHRMYPSDGIWRNINTVLHGHSKWPALPIAAFILLITTVGVSIYFLPKRNIFTIEPNAAAKHTSTNTGDKDNIASTSPFLRAGKKETFQTNTGTYSNNSSSAAAVQTANLNNSIPKSENHSDAILKEISSKKNRIENEIVLQGKNIEPATISPSATALVASPVLILDVFKKPGKQTTKLKIEGIKDFDDRNMVDEYLKQQKDILPLVAKKKTGKQSRFSYHVYTTPSASYRRLKEDRSVNTANGETGGPIALNYVTDVNKIVRHKPGTGFETGVGLLYDISKKVRLKTGLQLNTRQYNIEAYRSSSELATIALVTNSGLDSLSSYSVYRTTNGYKDQELVNRYFQLAIPIGLEWEIIGNKKVQLNVAGTLQPTYLLNKDAYLLTTNLKNYTENADMFRNWNLNTSFETFISYSAGDFKWQLGPQLRYQYLSTFIHQYPIKEHLIDYGVKIGFTKRLH
ncbi:MAG: hypothetical protein JWQ96_2502 [Segetibacter sp.]|nr:hypothetical protein [Segetibacter sp.]